MMRIEDFKKTVLDFYSHSGRSLPWRYKNNPDPWGVLVSEFMLQQTQVKRVIPYWERWMKLWPQPADLAAASLETVLKEWSGLGYNRRAKNLHACSAEITKTYNGIVPRLPEQLIKLPGIGPYTAGAIICFAWNMPAVFIETNIRSVLLHFFFFDKTGVKDAELIPFLQKCLDHDNPKLWYWALMDYGAELKKLTKNPGHKSAHYTKQSSFIGSKRQIRGVLIKILSTKGPQNANILRRQVKNTIPTLTDKEYFHILDILQNEMMVAEIEGVYRIAGEMLAGKQDLC